MSSCHNGQRKLQTVFMNKGIKMIYNTNFTKKKEMPNMKKKMLNMKKVGNSDATFLTVIFMILKLTGVINWSWWWVLSPLWICISVAILIYLGIYIYFKVSNK